MTGQVIFIYVVIIFVLEFYRRGLSLELRYYVDRHKFYKFKFKTQNRSTSYTQSNMFKVLSSYTKQNIITLGLVSGAEIFQIGLLLMLIFKI